MNVNRFTYADVGYTDSDWTTSSSRRCGNYTPDIVFENITTTTAKMGHINRAPPCLKYVFISIGMYTAQHNVRTTARLRHLFILTF